MNDRQINLWLAFVLRWGMRISLVTVLLGVVRYLFQHQQAVFSWSGAHAAQFFDAKFWGNNLLRADGLSIIYLGILMLMALPVIRLLVVAICFALAKDRRFMSIAFLILLIIALSIYLGNTLYS